MQRKLEETVKSQRCRLLALQSHLQCAFEATQTALPAFRTELEDIRKLTQELSSSAIAYLKELQSDLTAQFGAVFDSLESSWKQEVEIEKENAGKLKAEKEELAEELKKAQIEIEEWKQKSLEWQAERAELLDRVQLQDRQMREFESNVEEQFQKERTEHQQIVESLKEKLKLQQNEHQTIVSQWRSAAEQVHSESCFVYLCKHITSIVIFM